MKPALRNKRVLFILWHLFPAILLIGIVAAAGIISVRVPEKYQGLAFILTMVVFAAVLAVLQLKWWRVSPANQPETAIGKLFNAAPFPSQRSLMWRYLFFVVPGLISVVPLLGAPFIIGIFITMNCFVLLLWVPFLLFSRMMRQKFTGNMKILSSLITFYGMSRGLGIIGGYGLLLLDPSGFLPKDFRIDRDFILWLISNPFFSVGDTLLGFGAIVLISVLVLRNFFWRAQQLRQLENLATSKAASVALGLAELKGKAMPATGGKTPILSFRGSYFAIAASKDATKSDEIRQPFFLEDDSGRILVDPADAKVWEGWASALDHILGVREIALRQRKKILDHNDTVLSELLPGDPVYVIGQVERRDDLSPKTEGQPQLVVRPLKKQGFRDALSHALFGGRDMNDVFFLTDSDELSAKNVLYGNRRSSLVIGLVWFFLSIVVFLSGARWTFDHWTEVTKFLSEVWDLLSEVTEMFCKRQ